MSSHLFGDHSPAALTSRFGAERVRRWSQVKIFRLAWKSKNVRQTMSPKDRVMWFSLPANRRRFISLNYNRLKPLPQFIPRRLRNRLKPLSEDLDIASKEGWMSRSRHNNSFDYLCARGDTLATRATRYVLFFLISTFRCLDLMSGRSVRHFYNNLAEE